MANKIVLISDDSNFFDYIRTKLELRKSDELFMFDFDDVPEKVHLLETSVWIVNSENAKEKTLDLLSLLKETPVIVFAYNDDDIYRRKCFRAGALDFMGILVPDAEFRARMIPLLSVSSILEKNKVYRDILVDNQVLSPDNDVFLDYNLIIDKELERIRLTSQNAVFLAISPSDKSKFLIQSNLIESVILNNIRKNDILMNYAPNKYFLMMHDTDIFMAEKFARKIIQQLPEKIYVGYCKITNQKRQQLINQVLNKLHEAINNDKNIFENSDFNSSLTAVTSTYPYTNFKMFRQEFAKKIEQVISPVFYQIQQKYSKLLYGVTIEQETADGTGVFNIKANNILCSFKITCPGFSKIKIDITYQKKSSDVDSKQITLEPEEFESGLLEDLLEQFILDFKKGCRDDS